MTNTTVSYNALTTWGALTVWFEPNQPAGRPGTAAPIVPGATGGTPVVPSAVSAIPAAPTATGG